MKFSKRKFQKRSIKRKTPYKKKSVSFAVKKYVKSTIHKNIENKQHITYAFNQTVTGPQFVLSLIPNINNQGSGESQRIGNQVTLMNANIRFIMNMIPYNSITNPYGGPVHFRWILLTQRKDNSQSLSLTNFFEINNSGGSIPGTHLNQLLVINNDLYKVHRQGKFRLGNTAQSNNFPVSGCNYDNSKLSIEKTLYIGKYLHKKLLFDDLASGVPTNTNLWLVILPSYANGSTTQDYALANISYVITHHYEDA